MTSSSSNATTSTTKHRASGNNNDRNRADPAVKKEDAVVGPEVVERLKSWCYV
jgi:hypothetical protein